MSSSNISGKRIDDVGYFPYYHCHNSKRLNKIIKSDKKLFCIEKMNIKNKYELPLSKKRQYIHTARQDVQNITDRNRIRNTNIYQPYATMQLKRSQPLTQRQRDIFKKQTYKNIALSPFQRIKRVQKLIIEQKKQAVRYCQNLKPQITAASQSFKPHFKVKTKKTNSKKRQIDSYPSFKSDLTNEIRIQNVSVLSVPKAHIQQNQVKKGKEFHESNLQDSPVRDQIFEQELKQNLKKNNHLDQTLIFKSSNAYTFQQNFKNRCRLQKRSHRQSQDVSLMNMLNRLSQQRPIYQYKSRAFGSSLKVQPFIFQS